MKTSNAGKPMMLPWLARKAGITEHRAEVLWHSAQRYAALHTGESETPVYWNAAMDHLLELIAAEALREDVASFGLRRVARLQARFLEAPLALLDAFALSATRGWRILDQSSRLTAL
jgi:hypothetical protein